MRTTQRYISCCNSPLWNIRQSSRLNRIHSTSRPSQQSASILSFSTSSDESHHHHPPSNRSKFKEIPVNPSILSYIESVGIGIPKRHSTKRRSNRLRRNKGDSRSNGKFLTREEEVESMPKIRRMPSRIPPPPFAMPQSKSIKQVSMKMEENRPTSQKPMNRKNNSKTNNKRPKMNNQPNSPTTKHNSHDAEQGNQQPQIQRSIRRYPVTCIASVGSTEESFPPGSPKIPEVAIAGRSNVGKSTLLNALLYGNHPKAGYASPPQDEMMPQRRRKRGPKPTSRTAKLPKGLKAATSSKPGQTRTIDIYRLTAKVISSSTSSTTANEDDEEPEQVDESTKISLQLVDLPGYGFAYATEEKLDGWKSLMQDYILNRGKPLKRILLLIDARHGMKIADIEFLESLQQTLLNQAPLSQDRSTKKKRELPPIQIVLTKCDLVSQADLARRVVQVEEQLSDCLIRQPSALPVMLVSAQIEGQKGVLELQKELASLVPGIQRVADVST